MKLGIVVHCPSPHQKVLLDSIFRAPGAEALVAYAYATSPNRNWGVAIAEGPTTMVPEIRTPFSSESLRSWVRGLDRDVWVLGSAFTYPRTQALAAALAAEKLPWAYLGEPPRPRSAFGGAPRDLMLHRVLSRCHGVIATGMESARRYQKLLGDDRPVTSVPYYIPLDEWRSLPLVTPLPPSQPIRFLTLAQLIPRKGLDLLIAACKTLPPSGWLMDIYGDGPERNRLQRLIDRHALPITLHRPLPFAERAAAFRGAHCFVFPSRWDGWGMAPVEALAAGLPVIASDQAMSAHDFITPDRNGWLIPCAAPAIARAMQAVLDAPERLPELSRAARESVAGYEPDRGAAEFIRFCNTLHARHLGLTGR